MSALMRSVLLYITYLSGLREAQLVPYLHVQIMDDPSTGLSKIWFDPRFFAPLQLSDRDQRQLSRDFQWSSKYLEDKVKESLKNIC